MDISQLQPPMPGMNGAGGPPQMGGPMPPQQPMQPQMPQQMPPQAMMQQQQPDQDEDDEASYADAVDVAINSANLAKRMNADKLHKIAEQVITLYEKDERSRKPWMDSIQEAMKLATLIREKKSFPWPNAANVKYPLLATAAMQFAARAYPALVPSDGHIVKARIIPYEDTNADYGDIADRISKHMSYQVTCKVPHWEEDMDKLLMMMPIMGVIFKKTYYDDLLQTNVSKLVMPENLCVNYYATSIEDCYRKTEIIYLTDDEVAARIRAGKFRKIDLEASPARIENQFGKTGEKITTGVKEPETPDEATPRKLLEQHTFYDIDNDGYSEPVVITVDYFSREVVRITARYDKAGVVKEDDDIVYIKPVEYYTEFPFIPNPDGSIYALGFGLLLGPLNEAVNTIVNQLIDAGTLNNLQAGFIGKGLRIKIGETNFRPGEFKVVNASGEDLKNQIYMLETKEPSSTLYQLLNLLIQSGNQLASIAEIFVGKMPGQNTPATTTQEAVQQGMAVFTAIYKRIYRALTSEFKKMFRLNKLYVEVEEESQILNRPLQQSDYNAVDEHLIIPGADPSGDSATTRVMKLQQAGQMIQFGTINVMEFTKRMLQSNDVPNYETLIQQPPPPPPDPKVQTEQMKQQTMQQKAQIDAQAKQQDMQIKQQIAQIEAAVKQMEMRFQEQELALKLQGQQAQHHLDMVQGVNEMQHDQQRAQLDMQLAQTQAAHQAQVSQAQSQQQIQMGNQKLKQNQQAHEQSMKQQKEKSALAAKSAPKGNMQEKASRKPR